LEKAHPDVYRRIIESDRRNHTAIAQGYNHIILPLASRQTKRIQVMWGIQDFRHRYNRDPKGMWMAETAVDIETLDVMAECGIAFTVLSVFQAAHEVDITEPYIVRLPSGREITVFFYNPLSGSVSYDEGATADANQFAASYQGYMNRNKAEAGTPQITVVATDGELYGHHKPFRDRFLSHFLQKSASAYGFTVCSLEQFLVVHKASAEARIHVPSSWSCFHGTDRWSAGCGCDGTSEHAQRTWKPAMREALTLLQKEADRLFEEHAGKLLKDPWKALEEYILLRSGWLAPEHFWQNHAQSSCLVSCSLLLAKDLLEAEFWLQCSFTSCGWFFDDLDRLEPRNNIAFARRAISLIWSATGCDLQEAFLIGLSRAGSMKTGRTGVDLYRSLPAVPKSLLPPQEGIDTHEREQ
jgi:predicted glycosyl hydrolase (DUF1957 family)